MSLKNFMVLLGLPLLLGPAAAAAHHSVAGVFSADVVELTGVIADMDWINPHTHIYLDVTAEGGDVVRWELESLPTAMLRKAGVTKAMIMGDGRPVTVRARTARDPATPNRAYTLKITYADGHVYQLSAEE